MQQVGFDLRDSEDDNDTLASEAAFALAEHLTGVRPTADLLDNAMFVCGIAPLPTETP